MKKLNFRLIFNLIIYLVLLPLALVLGVVVFHDRQYVVISIGIAVLVVLSFFIGFDKRKISIREVAVITVMIAFSVIGRLIFAGVPSFKPLTAIVIITGIAFGGEAGFMVGALSALLSNFYFGQGPWTPFQMVSWGLIGLFAGLVFRRGKMPNYISLVLYGVVGGVLFSMVMDIWSVVSFDGTFNIDRYLATLSVGLPFMAIYAVSNVIFLLILTKPMLKITNRIRDKYGIFMAGNRTNKIIEDTNENHTDNKGM